MGSFLAGAAVIGGGLISAYGQYKEGEQQSQAASYNAAISRREADLLRKSADLDAYRRRKSGERLTSRQTALYAKAGVLLSGSPLAVIEDTMTEIELDAQIVDYNVRIGTQGLWDEAGQSERLARYYKTAGIVGAASTILTIAGSRGLKSIGGKASSGTSGFGPRESIGSQTGFRKLS